MSTVSELRQTLVGEMRRLEPKPGLEARVLQQAMHVAQADRRTHRARQVRPLETPRLMALIAAMLAVLIVISLVIAVHNLHLVGQVPSGHVPIGQATVVNPVAFRCSLPVTVSYPQVAVRVVLPGGQVEQESDAPANAVSYDVQAERWLPVPESAVSLDGRWWAYGTGMNGGSSGTVHIVDARTGKDRQVWSESISGAQVLGWSNNAVYFEMWAVPGAIWKFDTNLNVAIRLGPIPSIGQWDASSVFGALGGFAFITDSSGRRIGIVHMDSSGIFTTWFRSPSGADDMQMLGFGQKGFLVIRDRQGRVLQFDGPESYTQISDGSDSRFQPINAVGDSHGIWFGAPGAIWLYQPGTGLREIISIPPSMFPQPTPKFPKIQGPIPIYLVVNGACT